MTFTKNNEDSTDAINISFNAEEIKNLIYCIEATIDIKEGYIDNDSIDKLYDMLNELKSIE